MKKYRNKKTGVVIEVECEIMGRNWEQLSAPKPVKDEKTNLNTVEGNKDSMSYKELQQKAKKYGIKCVGKTAENLKLLIEEHEKQESEIATSQEAAPAQNTAQENTGTIIKARRDN